MHKTVIPIALLLAASPAGAAPAESPLLDVTWDARAIGETPIQPGIDITLQIGSDMRAVGSGGCNSFFSQATVTPDSLSISHLARTERSCFYERNMLEQSYFEALKSSVAWVIDGDTLILLDTAGKPTVTFEH